MNKFKLSTLVLAGALAFASCNDDDTSVEAVTSTPNPEVEASTEPEVALEEMNSTVTFDVTIRNSVNLLNTKVFNTPVGASSPGPNPAINSQYQVSFQAVPGTKMTFATMNALSNDWFYAPVETGIALWDESGSAVTGDITNKIYLWDSGTEEEDPATQAAVAPNTGSPDDDTNVRAIKTSVVGDILAELDYEASSKTFTLTITNLLGAEGGVVTTPGIVVLHAQDNPLFLRGTADRGYGLKEIAEDGNPMPLYQWINQKAEGSEAFLRLSSSLARFSPALAYAFDGTGDAKDPVFTQGEAAVANSGLEELAEDGNRMVAYNYIKDELGIPVALGDKMMPAGPGEEISFELTVPKKAGYKFSFLTMFVPSNDWFLSHNTAGLDLFDENGAPLSYDMQGVKTYLYDAGTEIDEPVGAGQYQVVSQTGPNVGPADADTTVRRVPMLMDGQFGKGAVSGNGAGVIWKNDPRGGYNLLELSITPR